MGRVLRWTARGAAALVALLVLVVLAAAVTDRPSAEPLVVDHTAPELVAYLDAEDAWMQHHGLEAIEHVVEVAGAGLRVRVLEVGEANARELPLLVVPGGAGEAARLAPLLAELEDRRFLLVNLPGGGGSDGMDLRAVDRRRLARDTLDAVYEHLDLSAVPIVATSRGGTWALWYGMDRPDRVAASVQLGAPGQVEGTTMPGALRVLGMPGLNRIVAGTVLRASDPEAAADGFAAAFGHPRETVEQLPRPALEFEYAAQQLPTYALTWRSLGQDSLRMAGLGGWHPDGRIDRSELADLDHPVLLVWPSDDPFGDVDVGRELADRLGDGRLETAGVGHLPWLDDPAGVAAAVEAFLDEVLAG